MRERSEPTPICGDEIAVSHYKRYFMLRLVSISVIGTDEFDAHDFAMRTPDATIIHLAAESLLRRCFQDANVPPETLRVWSGERSDCLRPPDAYPARPLEGVWATAPFLHNNSLTGDQRPFLARTPAGPFVSGIIDARGERDFLNIEGSFPGAMPSEAAALLAAENLTGSETRGISGTQTYDGLTVMKPALVPCSPCVNPLLTITAPAEHCCRHLAADRERVIDYVLPPA